LLLRIIRLNLTHKTTNMTKLYLACLFLLAFILNTNPVFATHSAGGELSYVQVVGSPNTYQFTFKFYRDCGAANQSTSIEPASFTLCYTSPCTGTIQNVTMPKIVGNIATNPAVPNGSPLNNGCNSITTCDNINSVIHGYRQWWYTATVTLSTTCNAWKFWTTLCCRNNITGNITTPPGSQYLYVETTFDNTVSANNSSPVFVNSNSPSSLPVPYICINVPYSHTGGAVDPDGDVLVFETIQPRSLTGCTATPATNILLPAYNLLNTAGDPLPTNNTYNLDVNNGHFDFTASTIGYYILCIKVSEYRSGVLIGTTMRDMQIVVDVCQPLPIVSQLDSLSIINGALVVDTVTTCPNSNLAFCFDIIDQVNPTANILFMSSDYATTLPSSALTTTNPQTNVLRVCVNWNSTMADTGLHWLSVLVKDTLDCLSSPGIAKVPIYVMRGIISGGETAMCYGDTASLWCYGNGQYSWTALPGGDDNASLSCLNCDNPRVWPDKTTEYEVTDVLCGFKDTVKITIFDITPPEPIFTLTPKETTMDNPTFTMLNHSLHAVSYAWYDSSHNFLSNNTDLTVTENAVGTYCYTLEASNFCKIIRASTQCAHIVGDGALVFPTAFTPNGDGKNDNFLPVIIGDMLTSNYTFSIYNRWGMQLFTTKDMKMGWNGKYKGKECESDTYFYYVEAYHALNQKLVYKGDVIIIR
jgi:gliding motility-associated-like protein